MFDIDQQISEKKLHAFCRRHHVRRLALFGSAQRNELGPDSDIDFLVEFLEGCTPGLFDLSRMELELTDMLGRPADIRTAAELSRYFRDDVVGSAKVQYEAK